MSGVELLGWQSLRAKTGKFSPSPTTKPNWDDSTSFVADRLRRSNGPRRTGAGRERFFYPFLQAARCTGCETEKRKRLSRASRAFCFYPGSDLLSHAVSSAVSSALRGLTAVFGMGTGVSPAVWPPGNRFRRTQGALGRCGRARRSGTGPREQTME